MAWGPQHLSSAREMQSCGHTFIVTPTTSYPWRLSRWPATLESALQLDFDTVVPGHGNVTTKREMAKFRESTVTLRNRIHDMLVQKKTRDDIVQMLRKEFHWEQLHLDRGLDGALAELQ